MHQDLDALRRRDVALGAEVANADHQLLQQLHLLVGHGIEPFLVDDGPLGRGQERAFAGEPLPQLLGDEGHDRMQETQQDAQDLHQHRSGDLLA